MIKEKRKPIPSKIRDLIHKKYKNKCILCGDSKSLHIHHINKNWKDNSTLNLLLVCRKCHLRFHGKKSYSEYKFYCEAISDLYAGGFTGSEISTYLDIEVSVVNSLLSTCKRNRPSIVDDHYESPKYKEDLRKAEEYIASFRKIKN